MPFFNNPPASAPATGQGIQIFGTRLVGLNAATGHKLILSLILLLGVYLLWLGLRWLLRRFPHGSRFEKVIFWVRQAISVFVSLLTLLILLSIWFDNPTRLATFMGLVTAGVAFALQKPISAIAGYLVILRGKTFNVGDRITMGGVRGDVMALRFTQTTIMEMGQAPGEQNDDPSMWVRARQYTGRIVTVSNSVVFDEPVYNYTREFPYMWDEMHVPITYHDDPNTVEQILLEVADQHTVKIRELSQKDLDELARRYFLSEPDLKPRVYWRLTDNWVELTVRFIARTHGVRELKDAMSRDLLRRLNAVKIGIASGTYAVVEMPTVRVKMEDAAPPSRQP